MTIIDQIIYARLLVFSVDYFKIYIHEQGVVYKVLFHQKTFKR